MAPLKMTDQQYRWYPIRSRSRAEKKASLELQRKGINVYLPLKTTLKQWSDRKKKVEEPLLPGYLFVHISEKEMASVLMTAGITRFVYFSGRVAHMPDRQIESLKLLLANEDDLQVLDSDLSAGQQVIVKAGPLKGMFGELVSVQNRQRVILRLEQLGYAIEVNTALAFVEPV